MPYIEQQKRMRYDVALDQLPEIETKGDLEFCVFRLMRIFMLTRDYKYSELHDAVKATEHAAHEFERRFLDPREDAAIQKNGDIE